MGIKVSVIIPAYNAEKYVVGAVNSALAQTLSEIEIIVVDDGSTDNTRALLTGAFGKNDKVRLFFQPKNMGVGEARNRGINEAKGEYIAFLDSDDAQKRDMLEKMYSAARDCGADVLHSTGVLMPAGQAPDDLNTLGDGEFRPITLDRREPSEEISFAPEDVSERLEQWCAHRYHWSVWNKLFSRCFIEEHRLRFDSISMAEDMIFCLKALFYAKRYTVLPGDWYIYRIGGVSLSRESASIETVRKLTEKQLRAAQAAKKFTSSDKFFAEHPVLTQRIHRTVCNTIELFYIHPAVRALSIEKVQEDGGVSAFLEQEFGDKSAYVEFLYWRLQELASESFDISKSLEKAEDFDKMIGNSKKRTKY